MFTVGVPGSVAEPSRPPVDETVVSKTTLSPAVFREVGPAATEQRAGQVW